MTSKYVQVAVFSRVICRSALQNHHPADRQTGKRATVDTGQQTGQHTREQTGVSPVRAQQAEHPADVTNLLSDLQTENKHVRI